jgi:hypothetical protein
MVKCVWSDRVNGFVTFLRRVRAAGDQAGPGERRGCQQYLVIAGQHRYCPRPAAANVDDDAAGPVLPGSITQRHTRCGHRNCGCRADPPRLHGPYWQWTRKVAARTICRWLSAERYHDYQTWIDNDRRLRELLARLEALGAAALEADPRWQHKTRPAPADTCQATHNSVGAARLTCGQARAEPGQRLLRPVS